MGRRGCMHQRWSIFDIHVVVQRNKRKDKEGLCMCVYVHWIKWGGVMHIRDGASMHMHVG